MKQIQVQRRHRRREVEVPQAAPRDLRDAQLDADVAEILADIDEVTED